MPFRFPRLTPAVRTLVLVLAGAFVASVIVEKILRWPAFYWLSLDPAPRGFVHWAWQGLTYVLVQPLTDGGVVLGTAISIFFAYLILAPFEERYGAKRTWQLILVAVLSGALPVMMLGLVWSGYFLPNYIVFGSRVLVLAGISAFAVTVRGGQIALFAVFPMKAWHLVAGEVVLSALMALIEENPFFFASALGAIFGGVFFARWMTRPRKRPGRRVRANGPALKVLRGGFKDGDDPPRWLN